MRVAGRIWTQAKGWSAGASGTDALDPQFVLFFGARAAVERAGTLAGLQRDYPKALLIGCSTGGEIYGRDVHDDTIVAAAVRLERSSIRQASVVVDAMEQSLAAGRKLGAELAGAHLSAILVLSDGTRVNGSALVRGLREAVGDALPIVGGMAGDGTHFQTTMVGAGAAPAPRVVAALGFYGRSLSIGHGSIGGWNVFGPLRTITKSAGNVLYELDGKPALDLYKSYLGDEAEGLPASALLFPLTIRPPGKSGHEVVRTIIGLDEAARSMIFAGDMPEGYVAQLMVGNTRNLIEGAGRAAQHAAAVGGSGDRLAILVSCVGRKWLLGQRIAEEIEAVADALPAATQIGFYSYGEIAPHAHSGVCELHNQTMTVTVFAER